MYKKAFILIALLPFVVIAFSDDMQYKNTRKEASMERRYTVENHTSLAKKSVYIKEAIFNTIKNDTPLNMGTIGYEMNKLESQYNLPYSWGGDIKDFKKGLDCTGFIHGIMYYLGGNDYIKRFNTYSLYKKLLQDKNYELVYKSNISSIEGFDLSTLKVGDIVMWPSGVRDAKNLPGTTTFGHIGIVSNIENNIPYITHYVRSDAYNDIDTFENKGAGINTLKAKTFITLKQRGVLNIFRMKNNV